VLTQTQIDEWIECIRREWGIAVVSGGLQQQRLCLGILRELKELKKKSP